MKGKIKLIHLILAALSLICLIVAGVVYINCRSLIGELEHQHFDQRWSDEGGFSQVSAFYRTGEGFTAEDVPAIRYAIDQKLVEASIDGDYESRSWLDCYSAKVSQVLTTASGKSSSNTVYAVGGDFFSFHPLFLISGSYFSESDLMHDLVVIDELTAWNLFGSTNCIGMTIEINELPYIVCGVVRGDEGDANETAAGTGPTAYMSFDMLGAEATTTCYEALLPNPIPGFALGIIEACAGEYDSEGMCVENTDRFSVVNEYEVLRNLPTRSMLTSPIALPYWENAARLTETRLVFKYIAILILLLFPALCLVLLLVKLWRGKKWRFSSLKSRIADGIYAMRCARAGKHDKPLREKKQKQKPKHLKEKTNPKVRNQNEEDSDNDQPAADADNARELSRLQ